MSIENIIIEWVNDNSDFSDVEDGQRIWECKISQADIIALAEDIKDKIKE